MKRDLDLIRKVVENLESSPNRNVHLGTLVRELKVGEHELSNNLDIAKDNELIAKAQGEANIDCYRLTWAGHDYLEALRKADKKPASLYENL